MDVMDRNDNAPVFLHESLTGWVAEHAEAGTLVVIVSKLYT